MNVDNLSTRDITQEVDLCLKRLINDAVIKKSDMVELIDNINSILNSKEETILIFQKTIAAQTSTLGSPRILPHLVQLFDTMDPSISYYLNFASAMRQAAHRTKIPKPVKSRTKRRLPERWTNEESEILRTHVHDWEYLGKHKWSKISKLIESKTPAQCAQRWNRVMQPNLRKGRWSPEEESVLLNLVKTLGTNWKEISATIFNRSDIQCRYAYMKAIEARNTPWSEKDDEKLLNLVHTTYEDVNWLDISSHFRISKRHHRPSRSALECKERYMYLMRKEC